MKIFKIGKRYVEEPYLGELPLYLSSDNDATPYFRLNFGQIKIGIIKEILDSN